MSNPKRTTWYDAGCLPMYFAFVPNEKAWKETVKELGQDDWEYPTHGATCSTYAEPGKTFTILITVNPREETSELQIMAVLAHEATHAMQYAIRNMTTPGQEPERHEELEAYLVQWAFQCSANAWRQYQDAKKVKKKRK